MERPDVSDATRMKTSEGLGAADLQIPLGRSFHHQRQPFMLLNACERSSVHRVGSVRRSSRPFLARGEAACQWANQIKQNHTWAPGRACSGSCYRSRALIEASLRTGNSRRVFSSNGSIFLAVDLRGFSKRLPAGFRAELCALRNSDPTCPPR